MKKKNGLIPLIIIIIITMACTIGYEGVAIGSDPDIEKMEDLTATALHIERSLPMQAVSTPEPTSQPVVSQSSDVDMENAGPKEYSVSATDFDCICQENGNVMVEFNFKGDQLEITNSGGNVDVYEKIGENRYKRSWMGYYILAGGEGDSVTETKVEEERSVVIILNDSGYVMEHYQGSSSSPCCFHTFASTK
jgi:hypothetical protein